MQAHKAVPDSKRSECAGRVEIYVPLGKCPGVFQHLFGKQHVFLFVGTVFFLLVQYSRRGFHVVLRHSF